MAISFRCPDCYRSYRVADNLAGKRVKCKDCGAQIQVAAPSPTPQTSAPLPEDHYGFADNPPTSRSSVFEEDDDVYGDVPPTPPVARASTKKKKQQRSGSDGEDSPLKFLWGSVSCVVLGFIAHEMPLHGFVLSKRGVQMDPTVQFFLAGIAVLLGALGVVAWSARAGFGYLKDSELPDMTGGQRLGWVASLLCAVILSAVVLSRFASNPEIAGKDQPRANPQVARHLVPPRTPEIPPFPRPQPHHTPSNPPPAQPSSPRLHVGFTSFRLNAVNSDPNSNMQDYTLEMDYQVALGDPGDRSYDWVLRKPDGTEVVLSQVTLQTPRGTLSGSVSLEKSRFIPRYQVYLRGPDSDGETREISPEFSVLGRPSRPSAGNPFPTPHGGPMPGMNRPPRPSFPRMPHRPPGFPGSHP